ncbi:MAG: tRNA (adenosine(37)-N6)-dimethylallyltransferase MiaA [Saprospiraceae bacterium]|nr:tRNA (adenosine(37)-N6)-dimethylallyltransferase MiaA [Saprospiraceae bacterium]
MKKLIVIGGPTASGKTAIAIRLAKWLGSEILSADSRQFYREMTIGTAKPSEEELQAVPHHFINSQSIQDGYSVGAFEKDALALLERLFQRLDVVIMTGGSGLYIKAVCEGLDSFPDISASTRHKVEAGEKAGGLEWLQVTLQQLDPLQFERIDRYNPARLRRAIEVCMESGKPYSAFLDHSGRRSRFFESVYLLLDWPRQELYQRIDQRVDQMIASGLEEEAQALLPYRNHPALKTVGYEEFFDFFDGKVTKTEAVDKIKQHTRNYAKRQITWFNKHGDWKRFSPNDFQSIQDFVSQRLRSV